jgi:hypothetical protein
MVRDRGSKGMDGCPLTLILSFDSISIMRLLNPSDILSFKRAFAHVWAWARVRLWLLSRLVSVIFNHNFLIHLSNSYLLVAPLIHLNLVLSA